MIPIFIPVLFAVIAMQGICTVYFWMRSRALYRQTRALREQMVAARRSMLGKTNDVRAVAMRARGHAVVRLRILPMDEEIVLMHPSNTMLNSAWENGICIPTACIGNARCGTCKVKILEGPEYVFKKSGQEKITLSMFSEDTDLRLSCCVKPKENMVVRIASEQALIDTILPMEKTLTEIRD